MFNLNLNLFKKAESAPVMTDHANETATEEPSGIHFV